MANKQESFEESLERLEALVEQMESGELSLEKMITHFEEGSALVECCSKKLSEVELKIEKLVKRGESLEREPFDSEE